jgi:hypothetical protein
MAATNSQGPSPTPMDTRLAVLPHSPLSQTIIHIGGKEYQNNGHSQSPSLNQVNSGSLQVGSPDSLRDSVEYPCVRILSNGPTAWADLLDRWHLINNNFRNNFCKHARMATTTNGDRHGLATASICEDSIQFYNTGSECGEEEHSLAKNASMPWRKPSCLRRIPSRIALAYQAPPSVHHLIQRTQAPLPCAPCHHRIPRGPSLWPGRGP